ncbi:hypothetical protein TGVAND_238260 [Toxoplasma gondii VAND]|uniref:Uncharacterized protein n=2 Tax=Toxoplasma gondii TaxID=5811 RepID=A0A086PGV2_TOXGO|nr:hypothetical protein TGVAND_238260 [Toxoplasma gondii VAND]
MDADGWYTRGSVPGHVMRETRCFRQSFYAVRRSRAAVYRRRISDGWGLIHAASLPPSPASHTENAFTSQLSEPAGWSDASYPDLELGSANPTLELSAVTFSDEQDGKSDPETALVPAAKLSQNLGERPVVTKSRGSVGSRGTVDSVSTDDPDATRSGFWPQGVSNHNGGTGSLVFPRPHRSVVWDLSRNGARFSEVCDRGGDVSEWKGGASCPPSVVDGDIHLDRGYQSNPDEQHGGPFLPPCALCGHERNLNGKRLSGSESPRSSDGDETGSSRDLQQGVRFPARSEKEAHWPNFQLEGEAATRKGEQHKTPVPSSIQSRLLQSAGEPLPPDLAFVGRRRQTLVRSSLAQRLSFQTRNKRQKAKECASRVLFPPPESARVVYCFRRAQTGF